MLIGVIAAISLAAVGVAVYVVHSGKKAEKQKYYDAAYKVLKEECLDLAIRNQNERMRAEQKLMLYLKWKDSEKQGYVFDPEKPVRIGRSPEQNDICIREGTVSSQHCVLFLYQGGLYLQDLNSRNGTLLKQGFSRHLVNGTEQVFSGDRIIVGSMTFQVTLFLFDMAYM